MVAVEVACPVHHTELAKITVGNNSDGQYHEIHALVTMRADRFRVQVVESWGTSHSPDKGEELGRRIVTARGSTVCEAVEIAMNRSREAGMFGEYMVSAISQAEDLAEEATLSG